MTHVNRVNDDPTEPAPETFRILCVPLAVAHPKLHGQPQKACALCGHKILYNPAQTESLERERGARAEHSCLDCANPNTPPRELSDAALERIADEAEKVLGRRPTVDRLRQIERMVTCYVTTPRRAS